MRPSQILRAIAVCLAIPCAMAVASAAAATTPPTDPAPSTTVASPVAAEAQSTTCANPGDTVTALVVFNTLYFIEDEPATLDLTVTLDQSAPAASLIPSSIGLTSEVMIVPCSLMVTLSSNGSSRATQCSRWRSWIHRHAALSLGRRHLGTS